MIRQVGIPLLGGRLRADKRPRFRGPKELASAALEIWNLSNQQGISIALCGGAALQLYGSPRLTGGVDFCADGVLKGLKRRGRRVLGGQRIVATDGVPVDLIVREDESAPLYQDALKHATRAHLSFPPVVRVEHLIAMKLEAQREQDLDDLAFLLSETRFDLKRTRLLVRKFVGGQYALRDLDRIVLQVKNEQRSRR